MIYRPNSLYQRQISRRRFMQQLGMGAASMALLSACQPTAPAAAPTSAAAGAAGPKSEWVTGKIPGDAQATFSYTSWEGEEEMRKWLVHFDKFFSENYPNVTVNADWGIPWGEYWTKLPTQLAGGAPIDMCWMHDTRAKTFASNGWLLPLDDFLAEFAPMDWPAKYYPSQVAAFQYEGKQYGFPYDWAPGGLYINADMFEEAGMDLPTEDWTMEQFQEAAIALSKDTDGDGKIDVWGCDVPVADWSGGIYWMVKNFGGDYWDEGVTTSKFDQPETIAAFQWIADLMWKHNAMPSADMLGAMGMGAGLAFSAGLIGMHFGLNDEAFVLDETIAGKFRWSVAPTPKGQAGRYQFVGGSAFSIPTSSTQPDMAYELIRFTLANPETLPISGEMGSQFVSNMDYYEYGLPSAESGVRDAFKHAMYDLGSRDGIFPNYHPKYLEWESTVFATSFGPLWTGEQRDAAVACMQCHEATNALLAGA
jgi:multiple sugar transport system substrate-binding protein